MTDKDKNANTPNTNTPNTNTNTASTTPESSTDHAVQSALDWAKEKYNEQYEAWMPWLEDTFLKYFTKDNRSSYAARETLAQTKITSVPEVDHLQDTANDLAATQLGQGGLLQPVGEAASEGMKGGGGSGSGIIGGGGGGGGIIDTAQSQSKSGKGKGKGNGKGNGKGKGGNGPVPAISALGL
ncbi:hypothetical protein GGS21DRAFT_486127 [Xylaria nigripes]|nr:hypothetical protein GGS21DRAFT_486127 [Xylaria nigripes]